MQGDKAGESYWSGVWSETQLNARIDIENAPLTNHVLQVWHEYYRDLFSKIPIKGRSLLEVGCGNSVWMGYFNQYHGINVNGMDYSPQGCEMSKMIFKRDGIEGEIFQADLFNPPPDCLEKFDVVCSFGVVEHFENTAETIKSLLKLLKPGGLLITSVPNLMGVSGWLQKITNKPVYDIHVPIDLSLLKNALKEAGTEIVDIRYYLSASLFANLEPVEGTTVNHKFIKKLFLKPFSLFTFFVWWLERNFGFQFPANKMLAGGIISVAKKPLKKTGKDQ